MLAIEPLFFNCSYCITLKTKSRGDGKLWEITFFVVLLNICVFALVAVSCIQFFQSYTVFIQFNAVTTSQDYKRQVTMMVINKILISQHHSHVSLSTVITQCFNINMACDDISEGPNAKCTFSR